MSKTLTFRCDELLWEKIKKLIKNQHRSDNYQLANFSQFAYQALREYKDGKIDKKINDDSTNRQKRICAFSLDNELVGLYNSFPLHFKNKFVEGILASYLDKLEKESKNKGKEKSCQMSFNATDEKINKIKKFLDQLKIKFSSLLVQ